MRFSKVAELALGCALSLFAGSACAWDPEGHRMVGEIAQGLLAAGAAREVEALLRFDRLADGSRSGRGTLGEIAS